MQAMYSQTFATTVEVRRRPPVLKSKPVEAVGFRGILAGRPLNGPDPVSCASPDGAEHDRQASLEFLHLLVMGSVND